MVTKLLIIGGYGNFGSFIAKKLANEPNIKLYIGGRNLEKAQNFVRSFTSHHPAEAISLDIHDDIETTLERWRNYSKHKHY